MGHSTRAELEITSGARAIRQGQRRPGCNSCSPRPLVVVISAKVCPLTVSPPTVTSDSCRWRWQSEVTGPPQNYNAGRTTKRSDDRESGGGAAHREKACDGAAAVPDIEYGAVGLVRRVASGLVLVLQWIRGVVARRNPQVRAGGGSSSGPHGSVVMHWANQLPAHLPVSKTTLKGWSLDPIVMGP